MAIFVIFGSWSERAHASFLSVCLLFYFWLLYVCFGRHTILACFISWHRDSLLDKVSIRCVHSYFILLFRVSTRHFFFHCSPSAATPLLRLPSLLLLTNFLYWLMFCTIDQFHSSTKALLKHTKNRCFFLGSFEISHYVRNPFSKSICCFTANFTLI